MTEIVKSKKKKILLVSAIIAAILFSISATYAYASTTGLDGSISVTVVSAPLYISSASVQPSGTCSITSSGEALICNIPSQTIGSIGNLTVTLTNPVSDADQLVTPTFTSPTNVLTVQSYSSNAVTIATGQSQTFKFSWQATQLGTGSLEIAFT